MKCTKCGSNKLKAYNPRDTKSVLFLVDNYWVLQDPQRKFIYNHSIYDYLVICDSCNNDSLMKIPLDFTVVSPSIRHEEIVLDLDCTLFATNTYFDEQWVDYDFKFHNKEGKEILVKKRPFLKEFIDYCIERFTKINFYTAAEDWYAKELIDSLNLPESKLGYIKTKKDTINKRPITFELENVKTLNDSFIVDDKPHVIEGYNNVVFGIKPFYYTEVKSPDLDEELIKVKNLIITKEEAFIFRSTNFKLKINLFLNQININCENINLDEVNKIMDEINQVTDDEMKKANVMTSLKSYPYFEESLSNKLVFAGLNYTNYEKLIKLISNKSSYRKIDKANFKF